MTFRIQGLDAAPFQPLYGLPDEELARRHIVRVHVTQPHSAPDRVGLRDAKPGETVLLLNHVYHDAETPYRGTHAIYVREGSDVPAVFVDEVPEVMRRRLLALRAFDAQGMMVDADVVEGREAAPVIERLLARGDTAYLHAHFAKRGCFAARIDRA